MSVEREDLAPWLRPTDIIDADHPDILAFVARHAAGAADERERAVRLYRAVRDGIRYDPYTPFHLPEHYRSSRVLRAGRGFCIPKASLLCAAARAAGIPARPGFAHVRNHLATRQLLEYLGSDLFAWHAFAELHLGGKWVKATPAFNRELCERHGVPPLEFDGLEDSIFQPFNGEGRRYMEYVAFLGSFDDIPVAEIVAGFRAAYGEERVRGWIESHERRQAPRPRFETEEVV
ncbi:MAG: transglutaminase domain-containing protein [Acidobacteria bacterium]|nr:transglutaminase domain-containing protein [Acidobacteriota bacterium]